VSVSESILFPKDYNTVNVGGSVTLMEASRDAGIRRIVFISSGAVYGDQEINPYQESAKPRPRSPYAVSKLASEYYIRTIGSLAGIEAVCLRVFNAYGPGQRIPASHPPIIPNFLKQSVENGSLIIHGDGTQTRDYVFIDDVVNGMISAASAPDIDQLVINIGSGVETSVRELAKLVVQVTGGKPEEIYNPRLSGGTSRMCADIKLAADKLKYFPLIPLEMGLRLTLERDQQFKK
jgi:UDP-glucose 4-epimerase